MEDGAGLGHGEIRHLTTGKGMHFKQIQQAVEFIERVAAEWQPSETAVEDESEPASRVIDFGSSWREAEQ
jgi:hypothetical protein